MSKYVVYIFLLLMSFVAFSQEQERKIIQFTGVVFAPDSSSVVPGVHIYLPKSGRGTTTNPYGFFSMPVLEGDSVVFSAVGFKRQHFIVPPHDKEHSLKVLITLEEDVTFLSEVEVFPYPTEAMFKEAVLALEMPNQRQIDNMNEWLSRDYMNNAYLNIPASPNQNHQYFMQMQMQAIQNRYQAPSSNLLNPFAWARFINSLKKN